MTRAPILVHPEQAAELTVTVTEEPVVLPPACASAMEALDEDLRDLPPALEEHLFQVAQAEPPPPSCCLYHETNGPRGTACTQKLYTGNGAIHTRQQTEERLRARGFSPEDIRWLLDRSLVLLLLLGSGNASTFYPYILGQCCTARIEKARYDGQDPLYEEDCPTCKAPRAVMCTKARPTAPKRGEGEQPEIPTSPTTPTCCLYHQTNGPRGASCCPIIYCGWGATYMRAHAEARFRDFGYTESTLEFVLDHPQGCLALVTTEAARDTILAYLRGLCCPARVQKADYENFRDPLQVTCSACKATAPNMCKPAKPGTITELVRLLDEKWLPLLEPYLNVEQQRELREDILTAAGEKS